IRELVVFPKPWKVNRLQLGGPHGWQQWLERLSGDGCHGVQILLRSWIKLDRELIAMFIELEILNKRRLLL
ncbi:hypothetical protein VIGAN_01404800, partial [Vigna angularis var. angularis]